MGINAGEAKALRTFQVRNNRGQRRDSAKIYDNRTLLFRWIHQDDDDRNAIAEIVNPNGDIVYSKMVSASAGGITEFPLTVPPADVDWEVNDRYQVQLTAVIAEADPQYSRTSAESDRRPDIVPPSSLE